MKVPTKEVLEMGQIEFTGNIVPHTWFNRLTYNSGLANLPAIIILAEICYWYRPRYLKDENTGALLGTERRFKGDKLQRSYSSFVSLGLSKKQAFDACHFLQSKGLITLETRTITLESGQKLFNQLYIGINPMAIAELNAPSNGVLPTSNGVLPTSNGVLPTSNGVLPTSNTYTETSTETSNREESVVYARAREVSPTPAAERQTTANSSSSLSASSAASLPAPVPESENFFPVLPSPAAAGRVTGKPKFNALKICLPDCIPFAAWQCWVEHRREIRHTLTERSVKQQINFLVACSQHGQPPEQVIEQSVRNGWRGLFELKGNQTNGQHQRLNASEKQRIENEKLRQYQAELLGLTNGSGKEGAVHGAGDGDGSPFLTLGESPF